MIGCERIEFHFPIAVKEIAGIRFHFIEIGENTKVFEVIKCHSEGHDLRCAVFDGADFFTFGLEEVGGSGLDGFEFRSQLFSQIKQSATFVKKAFTSKQISDVPLIPTVFGFVGFTFYKLDQVPTEARLPCLFVVPCNPASAPGGRIILDFDRRSSRRFC